MAWGKGDQAAHSRLVAAVYEDLRRVARRRLRAERVDHSLAPTALVHEAYMRLVDFRRVQWQNRAHFFAIAARVMRQILVDHARAHAAAKRGGVGWKVLLGDHVGITMPRDVHLLDLDAALGKLAGSSPPTVKRDWTRARACLFRALRSGGRNAPDEPAGG
jgi:RNA polymerase sigma factor (TIGR02999 family)